jgi:prophage maintenance system killer protein
VRLERQMSLLKNHVFENERVSVFSKIAFLRMSG